MGKKTTVCILGDICPEWGFANKHVHEQRVDDVFHDLLPIMRASDICVANLESPVTKHNVKIEKNSICLKATHDELKLLQEAGIHALALANNHILDYDVQGLWDTLDSAKMLNIATFGAGTVKEAGTPYIAEVNGIRIGFLAFAEQEFNCATSNRIGANRWDDLHSIDSIRYAKEACDWLIIQYHGGIEHDIYPSPWLQKRCRKMAEAGASFITCQHSHCIGTREEWMGSEILYGQGNSIFGYEKNNDSWNLGLIVRLSFSNEMRVEYIPIQAKPDGEHLVMSEVAEQILKTVRKNSIRIKDETFVLMEWEDFCQREKDTYLPMLFGWNRYFNKLNKLTKGLPIRLLITKSAKETR